jgi:hypothetical protein
MAQLISLDSYRARRDPATANIERLEGAIRRLEPLVSRRNGRVGASIEAELAAISRAVRYGRAREASERAERLADLLEHPAVGSPA